MIDHIKYLADRVELTESALKRQGLPEAWKRTRYDGDRPATDTIIFKFLVDGYSPVKALGSLAKDGRARLWKVEAVLPSLVNGHNGRPIRNRFELALAITRLQFLLSFLVCDSDGERERLVPGLGKGNLTYLTYVETSVQAQDRNHDLLIGSHVARLRHQRFATAVYWGESTRMTTRELAVTFYDKAAKMSEGVAVPDGIEMTRIEAVYKDADRLAGDARKVLGLPKLQESPQLVTLCLEDSHRLLRHALGGVTGFGWGADIKSIATIAHPKARLIAGILGDSIQKPYRLEFALRVYQRLEKPGDRTFGAVEKELRAFAYNLIAPRAHDILPEDPADLLWSEVHWPRREDAWANLMRDIGAPSEPDPEILKAWSETRFLATKPHPGALVGSIAPSPPPFRRGTL